MSSPPVLIALLLIGVAVVAVVAVTLLRSSRATEARETRNLDPERVEREVYEKEGGAAAMEAASSLQLNLKDDPALVPLEHLPGRDHYLFPPSEEPPWRWSFPSRPTGRILDWRFQARTEP